MLGSELAQRLEVSEATVSRILSGERKPSWTLMYRIRRVLMWSIERQVDAVRCGTYADEFRTRMERRRARSDDAALRGVRQFGPSRDGVSPLEPEEEDCAAGARVVATSGAIEDGHPRS